MRALRTCHVALFGLLLLAAATAFADPVPVRYPEGPAHGFLVLTDGAGAPLAHGELIQWLDKGVVVSQLIFRFDDGSLYDETVRFSQKRAFRLESYHLVQKGPSFHENSEARFDRSGKYEVRRREAADKDEETLAGTVAVPADTYNGMTSMLLKNLAKGAAVTTHLMAFTPKPRVLELHSVPDGSDAYTIGRGDGSATRFVMTPKVTGLTGAVATVVGKQPEPFRMWIAEGKAPVLVRFEGPLYADGPMWRIGLAAPSLGRSGQ